MSELCIDKVLLCPIPNYFRICVKDYVFDVPMDKHKIMYLIGRLASVYSETQDNINFSCPANEA